MNLREIKDIISLTKKKKRKIYKEKTKPVSRQKLQEEAYKRAMKGV